MGPFHWIVALNRVADAVFRKGGDVTFLVEGFKAVFDPHGGYLKKGGMYMPSLVAEIGHTLEKHLIMIGLMKPAKISAYQQKILDEKRAQFDSLAKSKQVRQGGFPAEAKVCKNVIPKRPFLWTAA